MNNEDDLDWKDVAIRDDELSDDIDDQYSENIANALRRETEHSGYDAEQLHYENSRDDISDGDPDYESASSQYSTDGIFAEKQQSFSDSQAQKPLFSEDRNTASSYDLDAYQHGTTVDAERVEVQRVSLDQIPVTLEFNIGVMKINRDSLAKLAVDDIVDLGCDSEGIVSIVVNSKEIGNGRLVSVNNRLAVQLISVGRR